LAFAIANAGPTLFCYTRDVANEEALFRRRLREIVIQKYGSLDRFYLETDFSKGHLSQILRDKRSLRPFFVLALSGGAALYFDKRGRSPAKPS
jgi:hypothetical protein